MFLRKQLYCEKVPAGVNFLRMGCGGYGRGEGGAMAAGKWLPGGAPIVDTRFVALLALNDSCGFPSYVRRFRPVFGLSVIQVTVSGDGMFSRIGLWQIVVIFCVFVVLFGYKRLPEIGKNLGRGLRNFRNSFTDAEGEDERNTSDAGAAERKKDDPRE